MIISIFINTHYLKAIQKTQLHYPLPKLKEHIFIHKPECIVQLVDNPSENALFLWLRLLLMAGAGGRVGDCDLCRLLRVRQSHTGWQSNRWLGNTNQIS